MFVETKLCRKNENDMLPEKDMLMTFSISWSSVISGKIPLGDNLGDNLGEAFLQMAGLLMALCRSAFVPRFAVIGYRPDFGALEWLGIDGLVDYLHLDAKHGQLHSPT